MVCSADDSYGALITDPESWRATAKGLVIASTALVPAIEQFWIDRRLARRWDDRQVAIYFMLCAFALENLMKAKLVENMLAAGTLSTDINEFPKELKSHDLSALATKCNAPETAEEYASILSRLSRSAIWYARYPAPTAPVQLNNKSESPAGVPLSLSEYSSHDRCEVHHLLHEFGYPAEGCEFDFCTFRR